MGYKEPEKIPGEIFLEFFNESQKVTEERVEDHDRKK